MKNFAPAGPNSGLDQRLCSVQMPGKGCQDCHGAGKPRGEISVSSKHLPELPCLHKVITQSVSEQR